MVPYIYSSEGGGLSAAPELEVSCVTGLPARTINRSCRFFVSRKRPSGLTQSQRDPHHFWPIPFSDYNDVERRPHEDFHQASLDREYGRICCHCGQLCAVDEPCRRRSGLSPLRPVESQRSASDSFRLPTYRRALRLSLAEAPLPAGSSDWKRALSVAVQLPLRSLTWAHQPAQLL